MAFIEVDDLHAGYGAADVLHGLSLAIDAGEIVAVLGANGAGKSTLLNAIMGLTPARSGTIRIGGSVVTRSSTAARVRRGLALAPEGREVFASLTVQENLRLGHFARHRASRGMAAALGRIFEVFPRLGERRSQLAGDLSGGEQQMLALGRALMAEPQGLLVDELSLGLAPVIVHDIYQRLIAEADERGLALCIVEQNTDMALRAASRAYVVTDGRIVLSGAARELRGDARLAAAYFGADRPGTEDRGVARGA